MSDDYDRTKPIIAFCKLTNLVKSEDWFKDGSTIVRSLRKGKGRTPFVDSTVKMRLKIEVNGK